MRKARWKDGKMAIPLNPLPLSPLASSPSKSSRPRRGFRNYRVPAESETEGCTKQLDVYLQPSVRRWGLKLQKATHDFVLAPNRPVPAYLCALCSYQLLLVDALMSPTHTTRRRPLRKSLFRSHHPLQTGAVHSQD